MTIHIEITGTISKTIKYPPDDKELCDWCLKWVNVEIMNITERHEFVCDNCLKREEE